MVNIQNIDNRNRVWATDAPINILSKAEIVNEEVINQSIELILGTPITSRLFNLNFGSMFPLRIFDNMDTNFVTKLMEDTLVAIEKWEDRIVVIKNQVKVVISADLNSVKLTIPYVIKSTQQVGTFSKTVKQ